MRLNRIRACSPSLRAEFVAELRNGLEYRTCIRRGTVYRRCFSGRQAVLWMTFSGHARDEDEAVMLGNELMAEGVLDGVGHDGAFANERLYFRFTGSQGVEIGSRDDDPELDKLIDEFRESIDIADRAYHFRTYRRCFIGQDAVEWFVDSGYADNVYEAVELGNRLMDVGAFQHVTMDHSFKNKYLFYRFCAADRLDTLRATSASLDEEFSREDSDEHGRGKRKQSGRGSLDLRLPRNLSNKLAVAENTRRNRSRISVSGHLRQLENRGMAAKAPDEDWWAVPQSECSTPMTVGTTESARRVKFMTDDDDGLGSDFSRCSGMALKSTGGGDGWEAPLA